MPKPTAPAVWAVDTSYIGGDEDGEDTKVESIEGATQGWRPGAIPPAEYYNHWQNNVGKWTEYLDDGVFENDIEIANPHKLTMAGGDIKIDPAGMVFPGGTSTVQVSVDGNVGANDYKHGLRVRNFPGSLVIAIVDGTSAPSTAVIYPNAGYLAAIRSDGAVDLHMPLTFDVGDRMTSLTWRIKGDGVVDITNADIGYIDSAGVEHSLGASSAANVSSAVQTLTVNVTDHVLASGEQFFCQLLVNNASLTLYGVEVTYDRP